jgi:DNA-binding transcriptional MerR regulator
MHKYPIAILCDQPEVHFEYRVVARLARVSEEFICQCEVEELVIPSTMLHGRKGLCCADVHKMKIIRHLHEDLGLNLEAVDFVLRYRHRIKMINSQLDEIKRQIRQKEREHQIEVLTLRRQLSEIAVDDQE